MGHLNTSLWSTIKVVLEEGSTIFRIYSIVDSSTEVGKEYESATGISRESTEGGMDLVS